jgi:AraC-like DNA-binding protein
MVESLSYYPFHIHENDVELTFVLKGELKIHDSALHHILTAGDIYVFNANDPHKLVGIGTENIILRLQFHKPSYQCFFPNLENAYFVCDSFSIPEPFPNEIYQLQNCLARIYLLYQEEPLKNLQLEASMKELLALLLGEFQYYTYKKKGGGISGIVRRANQHHDHQYFQRIYRIIDTICLRYREKLTLEKMAKEEFLSVSYLSRYIKEASGLTFSELLSLTRCEEAERQLAISNRSVDQIASDVGFANRKHLAVQFRRWFNQTPTEYRRSIAQDLYGPPNTKRQPVDYRQIRPLIYAYLDQP